MECGLCGMDIGNDIVMLPTKQSDDGGYIMFVCLQCAEKSVAYCKKHGRPHLGFVDDETTACAACIEEEIVAHGPREHYFVQKIWAALPLKKSEGLLNWAMVCSALTKERLGTCILRALVTRAMRIGKTCEEVADEIVAAKSAETILP